MRWVHVGLHSDAMKAGTVVTSVSHRFDIPIDNAHLVAEVSCNMFGFDMVLFEDTTC